MFDEQDFLNADPLDEPVPSDEPGVHPLEEPSQRASRRDAPPRVSSRQGSEDHPDHLPSAGLGPLA